MAHVKKTKQANPGLQFKEVLQLAGKSYKKQQQGGGKHAMDHKDAFGHAESVNGGEATEAMGHKEPYASLAMEQSEHLGSELTPVTGGGRKRKSTKKVKKTKGKKKGGKKKMTKKKTKKMTKKGKKSKRSKRH